MKRKRLIVMGFMGSCPIAGVIWQHVHYIVGLQRLGHDVFYIEDSARLPTLCDQRVRPLPTFTATTRPAMMPRPRSRITQ